MGPVVTGSELQDTIADMARLLGWKVFHVRPGQTAKGWRTPVEYDGKGWPDLCLVRDRSSGSSARGQLSGSPTPKANG